MDAEEFLWFFEGAATPMKTIGQHPISFRAASFREHLFHLRSRRAFTLVELLVIIAVIAILAATLLPALAAAKDRDRRAQCANNLRQICIATSIYASDQNGYMPPLKWRDGNLQYPYEMFRYSPVNVAPPTYDLSGGPYNLGSLWKNGVLVDGKIYYCPGNLNGDNLTYDYYTQKTNWPFGGDPAAANPGYVRAGYSYYPQSRNTKATVTTLGFKSVPFWPDYNSVGNNFTLRNWICVPLFKQTEIDQTKSMVVDVIFSSLSRISHKSGNTVLGLNAGFVDGHVTWQGINQNKNGFDPNEWLLIGSGSGADWRFVQSCWQP